MTDSVFAVSPVPPSSSAAQRSGVALQASGLSKSFANTPVLRSVDLTVECGEVRALLGSNGSGKSTFVRLITGTYEADEGSDIRLFGHSFGRSLTPVAARAAGVRTIHQEAPLVGQLSVADHFGISHGFPSGTLTGISRRALNELTSEALGRIGSGIDPRTLARDLSAGDRALVALSLALADAEPGKALLVLDESTALLPANDANPILQKLRELARDGLAVLIVTHRLREVTDYCDTLTVLREGALVLAGGARDFSHDEIVGGMVGGTGSVQLRNRQTRARAQREQSARPLVRVQDLNAQGLSDVAFDVWPGEIVGFAGLVGSGTSQLARVLAGATPHQSGTIEIADAPPAKKWDSRAAINAGVCFMPQDRHAEGALLAMSLRDNVVLPRYGRYWRERKLETSDVQGVIRDLEVTPPIADKPFAEFSGGNQQKALLGKWLLLRPKVLVLDDPTYGIDPHARETLLKAICSVADNGGSVIVISTEPEQLVRLCDRVLVLRAGELTDELTGAKVNEEEIILACSR
jgi:ribose transport system ATP-binding protein